MNDVLLRARGVDTWTATTVDFTTFAAIFAVGALVVDRSLGIIAALAGTAAAVSAFAPSLSTPAATLAVTLAILVSLEQARRSALSGRTRASSPPS